MIGDGNFISQVPLFGGLDDEVSITDHGAELLPLVPDCSGVSIWIAQWIPYVIPLTRRYRASHHYALSIR